ncbi:MAG TPA: ABC transporter permease [Longimicrobium sp.]|nr:ABC transporter permease [Longimicrobium sp.]
MILRLAAAEIRNRPGRAAFLLAGYALGVAVMVVLLAVGEAMLTQAQDEELLGGGDVVVVSAGVSTEMLKAGGVGSLFLGIDHARFIQRSLLESPRAAEEHGIAAASPIVDGAQVELVARGRAWKAIATGEIPSRAAAAGAPPELLSGRWRDTDADRRWTTPSQGELLREMDHFHQPRGAAVDSTWAEWHYFNAILGDGRWIYLTLSVGGRVGEPGRWGGGVLLTVREPGGEHRSLTRRVPDTAVRFDTLSPDLSLGGAGSVRLDGATYLVNAAAEGARVDLRFTPAPGRYFPPTDLGGSTLISGYVAPALYATAEGTVCLPRCETVRAVPAYHDHNWGVWRDVSWEWGSASDSAVSLLYGVVRGDSTATEGMFAYVVDGRGVRGVYRPKAIEWLETQPKAVPGATLRVPRRFRFEDSRRGFRVTVDVAAVHATDQNRPRRRWFLQMRGVATVEENGRVIGRLPGFFETYVD